MNDHRLGIAFDLFVDFGDGKGLIIDAALRSADGQEASDGFLGELNLLDCVGDFFGWWSQAFENGLQE